ncbi:phosphonate ABC transporter substrate-binding protein [Microbaculum marinisediminis]|uniref:Phosphonate ABC transporter substrate-binding protein n=1 Tax=Microbaculum marinisediminis TaxID=2931392 RepID=A0AAW5R8B1_9HYPH|nr:phosphonate ABC transporter substrate-binding protein [Microbaculum sp. A6E488]MCT8974806.1 phosphonate ABC transporter substrate-binding protein [Microbaculum sp. A6E488]
MNAVAKGLAAAAISVSLLGAAHAETTEINFGIISTESTQNLKTQWEPFLAAMEAQTGLKVKPFFASDYAGIIEGMRFGKVHVAWYGNKSAMEAVDRSDGEVFAQSVDVSGNPGYWSLLLAPVDSPINSLEDVLKCDASLNFGIGDPNSTSGFLVPTTFIFAKNGVDPKKCFKTVRNANHETNAMAVANNQVDVATNNTENLARIEENNPEAFKKIKVVWKSPLIPSDPLVWRKDLDQAAKDKIYTFMMSYGRLGAPDEVAKARDVLAGLKWAPFKPSSDAQLYPIRIMEITKQEFQVQADDKMAADEKAKALEELKAEKTKYEGLMAKVPQA